MTPDRAPDRLGFVLTLALFAATAAQLLIAALLPGLPQFSGKAFGARLVVYPLLMWLAPAWWWLATGRRTSRRDTPWTAFALIMAPFFIDVTGNTLDLYDTLWWWDDANHLVNWALLLGGVGLLLDRALTGRDTPRWLVALAIIGLGAIIAVAWELGEWFAFIRFGTELATAYTDTLGDLALGTLGGTIAAVLVAGLNRPGRVRPTPRDTL